METVISSIVADASATVAARVADDFATCSMEAPISLMELDGQALGEIALGHGLRHAHHAAHGIDPAADEEPAQRGAGQEQHEDEREGSEHEAARLVADRVLADGNLDAALELAIGVCGLRG